ncbi:MAG: hypothetical protein PHQ27_03290 [Victivallales bacterium]|nr:hypothetical protein [Victivallales bacterium]
MGKKMIGVNDSGNGVVSTLEFNGRWGHGEVSEATKSARELKTLSIR